MIPNGQYTAVVDEIEAGKARLELEASDGELFDLFVDTETLPEAGQHDSAVLEVVLEDETIIEAEYDAATTDQRQQSMQERFDRLSSRPPDDSDE